MLPRWRLVRPAADDDFVLCWNAPYGQVLVLQSWRLVRPAADDDFLTNINQYFYVFNTSRTILTNWDQ